MKKFALFTLFLPFLLLYACSDDEYQYPNVRTDFIDLQTDDSGTARYLLTDEGTKWPIRSRVGLDGLVPDTTYRTVTMYAPIEEDDTREAVLYNTQLVTSPVPRPEAQFRDVKTDPVAIQSIWRSGNYLNLILQVKVKDQKHAFHFVENRIDRQTDGHNTLHLTLYHDRNNDFEAFEQRVYLSVPLWAYTDKLQEGDRIVFHLQTYQEGMTSREFVYEKQ